jgi:hypothetical protein
MVLQQVVSGGQTGVDRAALDAAAECEIPTGGWCPLGRKAEDGVLPERYPLRETHTPQYALRTRWNVRDSDGTLILTPGRPSGGTALTLAWARRLRRPVLVQNPWHMSSRQMAHARQWLLEQHIRALNIAGPRESGSQGIYAAAHAYLLRLFRECQRTSTSGPL